MPEPNISGGTEGRRALLAKIAGSAAGFALLVMWMTPPTTPHPLAPSPLARFGKMHSDAPTLDPVGSTTADYIPSALMPPSMPWASPSRPAEVRHEAARPPDPAAADDPPSPDLEYAETDQPAPQPPRIQPAQVQPARPQAEQPQPRRYQADPTVVIVPRPASDRQYSYEQRRAAWIAAMDERSSLDSPEIQDDGE